MGCNAWNHAPDCDCGWGGVNYGSGVSGHSSHWQRFESYSTPNAKCPICGDKVFFYRSPFGGRVFFDEIGPPWPKHPCVFDLSHQTFDLIKFQVKDASEKLWKIKDGWYPVICKDIRVHRQGSDLLIFDLQTWNPSFPCEVLVYFDKNKINKNSPFFIRFLQEKSCYEISTLDVSIDIPSEVRFFAKKNTAVVPKKISLNFMLDAQEIDGGQWPDLFFLLVQKYNVPPSEHVLKTKAKLRSSAYLVQVKSYFIKKIIDIKNLKAKKSVMDALMLCEAHIARIDEFIKISELRKIEAEQAKIALYSQRDSSKD